MVHEQPKKILDLQTYFEGYVFTALFSNSQRCALILLYSETENTLCKELPIYGLKVAL